MRPRSALPLAPRLSALAFLLLAGCDRSGPLEPLAQAPPTVLAALDCTVRVASGEMRCDESPPGSGPASGLIVGGQAQYVFLAATNHAFIPGDNVFTFDVTVQNLIPQALGTVDGSTLDSAGVRVFFSQGPTGTGGEVSLLNADGQGFFLAADQPYFRWDEVLHPNQTSGEKPWEFAVAPGVTSFSFRVYVSAAVRFPDGWIDLTPGVDTLVAGASRGLTATVRTAVGNPLAGQAITWGTSNPAISTVDAAGTVTALAPGAVVITATAGPRTGTATLAVCPDLAVGEVYTASMPAAASLCLAGGASGDAVYTYIPVNLSSASALSLSVTASGIVPATGPPSPDRVPGGLLLGRSGTDAPASDESLHARMMERDARELAPLVRRADARVRPAAAAGGPRLLIVPGVPVVGDLWQLNTASGCAGAREDRTGRIVAVGQHVILVADTTNPAGGFTTAQYDSIALEFDTIAYPVVVDNFGAPADVDGNGRVVAFYTRAVNELSPPASSAVVAGFFTARDLFSAGPESCPRSNEGEMFYMLVPDPTGAVNGNVRTVSFVRGNTVGTLGHELQHLVNASRRVYVNNAPGFEAVWLNEGLSHVVEELMFYRTAPGLAPRGNIDLGTLTTGPLAARRVAAFNAYANSNYGRMRPWLQRPDTAGPVKDTDGLAVRGAVWGLLRYAADRRNGDDAQFWFALGNSLTTGKANLQAALGLDPDLWVRDFISAMYADDAVAGIGAAQQVTSWNFRSVYAGLGGVPHGTRPLTDGVALTLSYSRGGGSAYTRFAIPTNAFARVTALSAGVPPASPYALIVLRTK
jgi:hypothetical protein